MINTRGHCARAKIYVYNQSPVSIRTFRPTTWLSDQRNINACDSPIDAKNLPWLVGCRVVIKCEKVETVTNHGNTIEIQYWLIEKDEINKKYIKIITSSRDGWPPYSLEHWLYLIPKTNIIRKKKRKKKNK